MHVQLQNRSNRIRGPRSDTLCHDGRDTRAIGAAPPRSSGFSTSPAPRVTQLTAKWRLLPGRVDEVHSVRRLSLAVVGAVAVLGHRYYLEAAVSDSAHAIPGAVLVRGMKGMRGTTTLHRPPSAAARWGRSRAIRPRTAKNVWRSSPSCPAGLVARTASSVLTARCWPLPPRDGRPF